MSAVLRQTEGDLQRWIVELAGYTGWLVYHTHDSRRSEPGFPDLVLVHPRRGELVFAELKSDTGRVSHEQRAWLEALAECQAQRNPPRVFEWRPGDSAEIEAVLKGEA